MSTTAPPTSFVGWLRIPPGPWRPVAEAPTRDLAREALDARAAAHRVVDLAVLPTGVNPNDPPRSPRR